MAHRHRPRNRFIQCLGFASLVVTLLSSSPGVVAVRAEEAPADPKPAMQPLDPAEVVPARRNGEIEPAPRDPAAAPPEPKRGEPEDDRPIVLNTRGYNYGPDRPTVRPTRIDFPAAPAPSPQTAD